MIIYHKTNNKIISTCVISGYGESSVTHGTSVWDKHQEKVNQLVNNGDVFVTGATHYKAIYEGMFETRDKYIRYIKQN